MCKVVYIVDSNQFRSKSLSELRRHVEFFNSTHKRNDYDGDFVHRLVFCHGEWNFDDTFIRQINIVNGKVIFRRIDVFSLLL